MNVVLCFGDSNTWGYDPASNDRFSPDKRWTGVLQRELGTGYRVIEEGLNGRTTNVDDPIEAHRNGASYLPACLESHRPLDFVTIMLGTNDLKTRFGRSASDIALSAASLGTMALRSGCGTPQRPPRVLLIAPPPVAILTDFAEMFAGAEAKSQAFARYYSLFAQRQGLAFLDAGSVIRSSDLDGIHFEAEEHEQLGKAVAAAVRGMER